MSSMLARDKAIAQARDLLERRPVFLDTETTGVGRDDQVIEVGVVDFDGDPRFDVLIRPTVEISEGAAGVHGITMDALEDCPTFADVWPRLASILKGREIVTYNADFDMRMLAQSVEAIGAQSDIVGGLRRHAHCAMRLYARYWGEMRRGDYKWQRLSVACEQQGIVIPDSMHRAITDAEATRRVLYKIAEMENLRCD